MTIFIADDDPTCRSMLKAYAEKWGYTWEIATDGLQAWNFLSRITTPMLILVDWVMPGMSGLALCQKLRQEKKETAHYIILLSSRSERCEIVEGLEAGADDYVTKPFDPAELQARIKVGVRMLEMRESLLAQEKLRGVLAMAGAVCHELNQPLQAILGYVELIQFDLDPEDERQKWLANVKTEARRMGAITRRIMGVTRCSTKDYLGGQCQIVDLEQSV